MYKPKLKKQKKTRQNRVYSVNENKCRVYNLIFLATSDTIGILAGIPENAVKAPQAAKTIYKNTQILKAPIKENIKNIPPNKAANTIDCFACVLQNSESFLSKIGVKTVNGR